MLSVVLLAALLMIAVVAAAPNLLTQGRREKEEEMIWRGRQYARAVRLYYRKFGRFPQSVEDLTTAKSQLRFLRKAYADPMNAADGSWRLIYVGPSGQLIGSVKRVGHVPIPGTPSAPQTPAQAPASPAAQGTPRPQPAPPSDAMPQEPGQPAPMAPAMPAAPTPAPAPAAASEAGLEGKVFGGNIIGVASKINRSSIMVYEGGTTYREWEFIWDPSKDAVGAAAPAAPPVNPVSPLERLRQRDRPRL